MVAGVEPNATDLSAPKPSPAMVTVIPGWPTWGPMEPTSGAVAFTWYCQTETLCAAMV